MVVTVPPSAQGGQTYYLGVFADSTNVLDPETSNSNNGRGAELTVLAQSVSSLSVTVQNVPQGPAPASSTVQLLNSSGSPVASKTISGTGPALFTGLTSGASYRARVNQTGDSGVNEYWGTGNPVTVNGSTTHVFNRNQPYMDGFIFQNASTGVNIPIGSEIPAGTSVRALIPIGNSGPAVTATFSIRPGSSAAITPACIGSASQLTCTFTASSAGAYTYFAILSSGGVNVDSHNWSPAFTVPSTASLSVTVQSILRTVPTGESIVRLYSASGSLVDTKTIQGSGPAIFAGLTNGTSYTYRVEHPGAFDVVEYWGSRKATVNGATSQTFDRSEPYITGVAFVNTATNEPLNPASQVAEGATIRATLGIGNGGPPVTASLRMKPNATGEFLPECGSGVTQVTCNFQATIPGQYTFGAVLNTSSGPVDTSDWQQAFKAGNQPLYSIRGTVRDGGNQPLAGVTVILNTAQPRTATTATDGTYEFAALETGNYTVAASISGYVCQPPERRYSPLSSTLDGQDFSCLAETTPKDVYFEIRSAQSHRPHGLLKVVEIERDLLDVADAIPYYRAFDALSEDVPDPNVNEILPPTPVRSGQISFSMGSFPTGWFWRRSSRAFVFFFFNSLHPTESDVPPQSVRDAAYVAWWTLDLNDANELSGKGHGLLQVVTIHQSQRWTEDHSFNSISKLDGYIEEETGPRLGYMTKHLEQMSVVAQTKTTRNGNLIHRDAKPIVFVHGINGEADYWHDGSRHPRTLFSERQSWELLYNSGYEGLSKSGDLVCNGIKSIQEKHGSPSKVDMIAHSYGGPVSIYAGATCAQGAIDRMLMLAPPNHGSLSAWRIWSRIPFSGAALNFRSKVYGEVNAENVRDLSPGSDAFRQLTTFFGMRSSENTLVVAGTQQTSFVVSGEDSYIAISPNDDGVVTVNSASLLRYGIPLMTYPKSHTSIHTDGGLTEVIRKFIEGRLDLDEYHADLSYQPPPGSITGGTTSEGDSADQLVFYDLTSQRTQSILRDNRYLHFGHLLLDTSAYSENALSPDRIELWRQGSKDSSLSLDQSVGASMIGREWGNGWKIETPDGRETTLRIAVRDTDGRVVGSQCLTLHPLTVTRVVLEPGLKDVPRIQPPISEVWAGEPGHQFRLEACGFPVEGALWRLDGDAGSISNSGLYTPPPNVDEERIVALTASFGTTEASLRLRVRQPVPPQNNDDGPCDVEPSGNIHANAGQIRGEVYVDAQSLACTWSAQSLNDWISLEQLNGRGKFVLRVQLAPNLSGPARTGAVAVNGKTIQVVQEGTQGSSFSTEGFALSVRVDEVGNGGLRTVTVSWTIRNQPGNGPYEIRVGGLNGKTLKQVTRSGSGEFKNLLGGSSLHLVESRLSGDPTIAPLATAQVP
jgi:pimeloyl-ACP methyl ester carboxylesterase